jgi:hypothetical protein
MSTQPTEARHKIGPKPNFMGRRDAAAVVDLTRYDNCAVCGSRIRIICFQGTGVCSGNCRKVRDGEA